MYIIMLLHVPISLNSVTFIVGKPTEVFLDIYVESFGNIKEVNMVRS